TASRVRALVAGTVTALLITGAALAAGGAARAAELPTVVINEVESHGGTPADWVELKNFGTDPVDVSGWILKDDKDSRTKAIPADTTIAPGGYLTVVVDEAPNGFGLGGADSARLYLADGTTLVDGTSWGPSHARYTWGRCADGTGAFAATTASTKDAPNACPDAAASLKINEAVSDGGTPGDWIEFVNTADVPIDAGGLVVRDNGGFTATGNGAPAYRVTAGSLPDGVRLVAATGQLVGESASAGTFTITVEAVNGADVVASGEFVLTVVAPEPPAPGSNSAGCTGDRGPGAEHA